ncbi:MAG: hypothetical protein WED00_03905 [Aquisalimonadaceae bacterium]
MNAQLNDSSMRESARDLIHESCLILNEGNWSGFLDLCDPEEFRYSVVNYSPEIRREQCWMDRGHKELKTMFDLLPRHNSDHAQLTRQPTVCRVSVGEKPGELQTVSLVTVYRTQLDGVNSPFESGQTSLYAVGRYIDRIRLDGDKATLLNRTVRLDTRQLDIGSHLIF